MSCTATCHPQDLPGLLGYVPAAAAADGPADEDEGQANVGMYQGQLEQCKILYKQKMAECQHLESLIENLTRQHDALKAQQEAFLEQQSTM